MSLYKRKFIFVHAFLWTGSMEFTVIPTGFLGTSWMDKDDRNVLSVWYDGGEHISVPVNYWLIKDAEGIFSICEKNKFLSSYKVFWDGYVPKGECIVDAVQIHFPEVWLRLFGSRYHNLWLSLVSPDGTHRVHNRDWIIKDKNRSFYSMTNVVFRKTFDKVTEGAKCETKYI
jgi:hypothetical protein